VAVASSIAFGIGTTLTIAAVCYLLLIPTSFLLMSVGDEDVSQSPFRAPTS
jgi:hypothetical protein